MKTLFSKSIQLIKCDSKDVQCYRNLILNKCCSFELSILYPKKNQHIRLISEGSCDTEDWSNDAENSDLPSQE